jgi:oligoribonuclease NrnB/cAMP/cGMP phosphodiesterase (DHH superfamily)
MGKIIQLKTNMGKLTDEEFAEFKQNYIEYQQVIFALGNLEAEYTASKNSLLIQINAINEKKQAINNTLGEKYGEKQVDLETGELN